MVDVDGSNWTTQGIDNTGKVWIEKGAGLKSPHSEE